MIRLGLRGMRAHPAAFLGTFVSIGLAVTLVTITLGCAIAAQDPQIATADPELADLATVLLGNAAAVAMLAAAFVASSTLAQSAVQRQRELAMLRLAGASALRVGTLLIVEAALVGVLAAGAGVALGLPLAPVVATVLSDAGFAPPGLAAALAIWPAAIAVGVGLAAILLGALPVAISNARIPPMAALREASAPRLRMTASRWVLTALLAAGLLGELPLVLGSDSSVLPAYLVLVTITAIPLCASCGPLLVPATLAGLALAARRGFPQLAVTAAQVDARRAAATATPMVVTIGLAAALLSVTATIAATGAGTRTEPGDSLADLAAILSAVGLTLLYTGISVAVTFAMSTARRREELTALRLAGSSRLGALGVVALDVVAILIVALVQVAIIVVVVLLFAVARLSSDSTPVIDIPLLPIGVVTSICALLAASAALMTARVSLRPRLRVTTQE